MAVCRAGQTRPNGMAGTQTGKNPERRGAPGAKLRVSGGVETVEASGLRKGEEAFLPTCSIHLTYDRESFKNG